MSSSPSSSSPSSKSPFTQSEHSDLAMALSSLSLDKENSAPPSSSSTSTTTTSTSSRKRKGCFRDCWFRVPLEDITHLYHPNIVGGDVKEVVVELTNASPGRLDAPVERRIVTVRRQGVKLKVKPLEMKTKVSLRKEFR